MALKDFEKLFHKDKQVKQQGESEDDAKDSSAAKEGGNNDNQGDKNNKSDPNIPEPNVCALWALLVLDLWSPLSSAGRSTGKTSRSTCSRPAR